MSQGKDNTRKQECKHLTLAERETMERMLRTGSGKRAVARALNRDLSVIKREFRRGSVEQREVKKRSRGRNRSGGRST